MLGTAQLMWEQRVREVLQVQLRGNLWEKSKLKGAVLRDDLKKKKKRQKE